MNACMRKWAKKPKKNQKNERKYLLYSDIHIENWSERERKPFPFVAQTTFLNRRQQIRRRSRRRRKKKTEIHWRVWKIRDEEEDEKKKVEEKSLDIHEIVLLLSCSLCRLMIWLLNILKGAWLCRVCVLSHSRPILRNEITLIINIYAIHFFPPHSSSLSFFDLPHPHSSVLDSTFSSSSSSLSDFSFVWRQQTCAIAESHENITKHCEFRLLASALGWLRLWREKLRRERKCEKERGKMKRRKVRRRIWKIHIIKKIQSLSKKEGRDSCCFCMVLEERKERESGWKGTQQTFFFHRVRVSENISLSRLFWRIFSIFQISSKRERKKSSKLSTPHSLFWLLFCCFSHSLSLFSPENCNTVHVEQDFWTTTEATFKRARDCCSLLDHRVHDMCGFRLNFDLSWRSANDLTEK